MVDGIFKRFVECFKNNNLKKNIVVFFIQKGDYLLYDQSKIEKYLSLK